MHRTIVKCLKGVTIGLLALLLLFSLTFAWMQTEWAQKKIASALIYFAKEQGVALTIGSIQSNPPFKWNLAAISILNSATPTALR